MCHVSHPHISVLQPTPPAGGSKVVFMTEGILLRLMASDPLLSAYDVIIVDEVHERHLNTDFLLALLRWVEEGLPGGQIF